MARSYLAPLALAALLGCGAATAPAGPIGPASAGTRAAVARAEEQERARRYDRASALYEAAVRDAPDRPSRAYASREFASALLFWGEYARAAQVLARLVELAPDSPAAWHDLGLVRYRTGDPAGAEAALGRAIDLAPRDPRPRIARAALFVNQRRYQSALLEYERLLELDLPERTRRAILEGMRQLRAELQPR